ncbi:MAG: Xaa-Pro peptidase family protein [Armatimonadota bacterium]|nr:Xaa-Pro peptidase family protein [Armatimonadota bacterium]MDR7443496.1 Xaa-Pro peptidase family protein [Armatimonadota bacterium]MDR7569335.1 Xaa-Pro peptidase family protein [Armatimonadota bacterium]MDR7614995.1 Xaa-Pro peptidase family protein [Armatimonadota bacterium]
MIPREEYRERQERVRAGMRSSGLRALVVVSGPFYERPGDVAYLSGHFPPFPTSEAEPPIAGMGYAAVVLDHRETVLLVDTPRYRAEEVVADEVRVGPDLWGALVEVLRERAAGEVGVVGTDVAPLEMARRLEEAGFQTIPADGLLRSLRRRKSAAEVDLLRRAVACAREGLVAACTACLPGTSEQEVCATGVAAALRAGADFVRYLRVHSGPWSAWTTRWPPATDRRLIKSDLVLLDLVGAREGYHFDVLRTTLVGFDALPWQRVLLEATQRALARALESIRPGVQVHEVVAAALGAYEEAGLGGHASTFLGHGIGLETVEAPYLRPGSAVRLEEGMVLCVEPSVCLPGRGGACIEEEVVVTREGCEVLTGDIPRLLWA